MTRDVLTNDASAPPAPAAARGNQSIKVLVFSGSLEPGDGAAPVALANALLAEGMTVLFAAPDGPLRATLERKVTYLLTDVPDQAPVKTAHEMSRYLRHHRPEVVHSHGTRCGMVAAVAVKAGHGSCLRVLIHRSQGLRRLPRWIAGPLIRRCADHYFAVGVDLATDLESLGVPAERISLVPGGTTIDTDALALDSIRSYRVLLAERAPQA